MGLRQMLRPRPVRVFEAVGTSRYIRVTADGWMAIGVRTTRWMFMPERRKEGRDQSVRFPLWAIRGGWLQLPRWWWLGVLVLDVPEANDPWGRRTNRQRKKGTFPKTRPHRIRFWYTRQPVFVECAVQIGVEVPDEAGVEGGS